MKRRIGVRVFILAFGFLLFNSKASAQNSAVDPVQDLRSAFQRENSFLASQKENLRRQRTEAETRHQAQAKSLLAEIANLEKKVIRLTSENESSFARMQEINQEKKLQVTRDHSLALTLKKALKRLDENERALRFEAPVKLEPEMPEVLSFAAFAPVQAKALDLLARSSQKEDLQLGFRNEKGEMTEGLVRRFGRIAAHVLSGSGRQILGPDGKGQLQVLDEVQAGQTLVPAYVFESLTQAAQVRKPVTWLERAADFVPALFLLLMFALVAGLFAVFVRE